MNAWTDDTSPAASCLAARLTCALALSLLGNAASALGLGEVRLHSSLGQPLSATIPLTGYAGEALTDITVQRASGGVAARGVTATLAQSDLGPVVRLQTDASFREPLAVVPVRLGWSEGELLREYTLLLDAPGTAASAAPPRAAAAPAPAPAPRATTSSATAPGPVLPAFAGVRTAPEGGVLYGPVAAGETLYGITVRLARENGIDRARLESAIVRGNPAAFVGGDAGRLLAGAVLRVPVTPDALARVPAPAAVAEVAPPAPAPAAAPVEPTGAAETTRLRDLIAETRLAIAAEERRREALTARLERANAQIAGLMARQEALDARQVRLEEAIAVAEARALMTAAPPGAGPAATEEAAAAAPVATVGAATPATVETSASPPAVPQTSPSARLPVAVWADWPIRPELVLGAALALVLAGFVVSRITARVREAAAERGRGREEEAAWQRIAAVRDQVNEQLAANDTLGGRSAKVVDLDSRRVS